MTVLAREYVKSTRQSLKFLIYVNHRGCDDGAALSEFFKSTHGLKTIALDVEQFDHLPDLSCLDNHVWSLRDIELTCFGNNAALPLPDAVYVAAELRALERLCIRLGDLASDGHTKSIRPIHE